MRTSKRISFVLVLFSIVSFIQCTGGTKSTQPSAEDRIQEYSEKIIGVWQDEDDPEATLEYRDGLQIGKYKGEELDPDGDKHYEIVERACESCEFPQIMLKTDEEEKYWPYIENVTDSSLAFMSYNGRISVYKRIK